MAFKELRGHDGEHQRDCGADDDHAYLGPETFAFPVYFDFRGTDDIERRHK
jgi:hypothetical protein